jgi:tol-pal system protein YbgF
MKKRDWMKTGILWGVGVVLFGCATAKETQTLNTEIVKLELQIYSVQKEKDALKDELTAFQKEARNSLSRLEKELATFQKEAKMSLSALQKELDRLRTDVALEDKNLQTDGNLRFETLQSQVARAQKEKDFLRSEFMAFQKEAQNDVAGLKKEDQAVRRDLVLENKKSWADLSLRLDALQSEIRALSAGAEENKQLWGKPSKEIDFLKEDLSTRMKNLEEKGRRSEESQRLQEDRTRALEERLAAFSPKQTGPEKSPSDARGSFTVASNIYMEAYQTLQRGDLDRARNQFEAFLKDYPDMELSDNAQFWIAESYYQKKDFEKAILEYENVMAKFPAGDKVPAALYKQALAFLELGDKTNARTLFKRLIERYPRFEQVETAKKKLNSIQ